MKSMSKVSDLHDPVGSLAIGFRHLLDHETQEESWLVEETSVNDIVP